MAAKPKFPPVGAGSTFFVVRTEWAVEVDTMGAAGALVVRCKRCDKTLRCCTGAASLQNCTRREMPLLKQTSSCSISAPYPCHLLLIGAGF